MLHHLLNEAYERSSIPSKIHSPEFRKELSSSGSSGAPIPFNKNRGKQRTALNGGCGGNSRVILLPLGRESERRRGWWPRGKKLNRAQGSVTQLYSEYLLRLYIIYRGREGGMQYSGLSTRRLPCGLFLSPSATASVEATLLFFYHFSFPLLFSLI